MFYLSLSLFPPREAGEIWFANTRGHWYCWAVEVAAHGVMWMALRTESILPWAITCPAAIGCCVILLTMREEHYISHPEEGSVMEALTALWRSVQPAGAPNGNIHHVLTTGDKSSKLQIGCSQMQREIFKAALSRLNMLLFSTYWTLSQKYYCILSSIKPAGQNCESHKH